jgi:two-component system, chemotaxis family, protein-glutamate methylesterase/glutaminase
VRVAAAVVVVGTSLGGLCALKVLLAALPRGFPLPTAIVQHREPAADDGLAQLLGSQAALPVSEPYDKERLEPGHVYLAPANYHLLVEPGRLALSTEAPVNHARPSVDVLFESAAEAYGSGVVAVVLTGANNDGAKGCARIKERGGVVIVQDPTSAESGSMPAAAMAASRVDKVLPLPELAVFLAGFARSRGGESGQG